MHDLEYHLQNGECWKTTLIKVFIVSGPTLNKVNVSADKNPSFHSLHVFTIQL